MKTNIITAPAKATLLLFFVSLCLKTTHAQESDRSSSSTNTYHNQLFFNRFLINPTFSLVRENKSYLNILHRNQYATFEDNSQNYFLGYSGKLNEHTAMGIGVYSQWAGVIQQFGFNANYATAVQLGAKSTLTFGTNVTYFNEGLDKNRTIAVEDDVLLSEARKESKLAIQPGIALSLGNFDFGLYATDLVKYNQTTNEFTTNFTDKTVKASLQYSHNFIANRGLFENARLMPLMQVGKNEDGGFEYLGSLLLDMPQYGWLQTSFDNTYGLSAGVGFNLSKKMSLGYLLEKDLSTQNADLGWNHEVSMAYTFSDSNAGSGLFADASKDQQIDGIVRNYEEQILNLLAEKKETERLNKTLTENIQKKSKLNKIPIMASKPEDDPASLAYQNRLILDELILRQDSIEAARTQEFERRFEMIIRTVRNEIKTNLKTYGKDFEHPRSVILAKNEEKVQTTSELGTIEHKGYLKLPIKVLGQSDMIGVKSGYYVIANVFKTKKYLESFMKDLHQKGLDAKQFYNKENGLHYVYLADFNFKEDAETAYVSDLNGKYTKEKWIMQVDNQNAIVENMYVD